MEKPDAEDLETMAGQLAAPAERFVRRLERTGMDPSQAATMLSTFERDIASSFQQVDFEHLIAHLREMSAAAPDISRAEWVRSRSTSIPKRDRRLCDFVRSVEERFPLGAGYLIMDAGFLSPPFMEAWLRSGGYLERARRSKKEARMHELRSATPDLIEGLYFTYVEAMYRIECLRRDEQMRANRGGDQVKALAEWTRGDWPNLVDHHAAFVRNGAAHFRRWRYDPDADAVTISDRSPNVPPLSIPTRELYARYKSLWLDVNGLFTVLREVCNPSFMGLCHDCGAVDVILGRRPPDGFDNTLFDRHVRPTRLAMQRLSAAPRRRR